MNAETPALIAGAAGSLLLGSIYLHERRREQMMLASRVRLGLRFPVGIDEKAAVRALAALCGIGSDQELVLETIASSGQIRFGVLVPASAADTLVGTLTAIVPGLRASATVEAPSGLATVAAKVHVPHHVVLREGDAEGSTRALLGLLGRLAADETAVVRWALRPGRPRPLDAGMNSPDREEKARQRAVEKKAGTAGLQAAGLVLVRAGSTARAREIAEQLLTTIRSREVRHGAFKVTRGSGRSLQALPRTTRSSGWLSTLELGSLTSWPLGDELIHGVQAGGARERMASRDIPHEGRRLFIGRDPSGERTVALSTAAAKHHLVVVGPSGVGKSVLITRAILDDIAAGHAGIVLDPKADLLDSILERVRPEDAHRMVVLDPADSRPVPGIDILHAGDPDLRADVILGALASIFHGSFGIRSELYGRLALRTLGEIPSATLADMGTLFTDPSYRRQAVARLEDPMLIAQWAAFDALSPGAQAEHVQSPMAKVVSLIGRPAVRAVLASPDPRLSVERVIAERKWLLISLSPGTLGEPASKLLGAVLLYSAWAAIESRSSLPPEKRHPAFVYVDEFATLASLPFSFELLAERARGLGAGLVVALQTLGRLPESVRSSLLGNVASLISFRAAADESARLARELPGLDARDLQSLGRFEVAARIGTGVGSGVSVVTGRTEPLPPKTGNADEIRDRSSERYGSPMPAAPPPLPAQGDDDGPSVGYMRRQS